MKPFYGTSLVTKIPYGLGFAAGTLIPGSLLYKVGGRVARGLGLVEKLIDADKIADLTKIGKMTRGAVSGALYGAGMHAEDPLEYASHVLTLGTMGGVGEVAI